MSRRDLSFLVVPTDVVHGDVVVIAIINVIVVAIFQGNSYDFALLGIKGPDILDSSISVQLRRRTKVKIILM